MKQPSSLRRLGMEDALEVGMFLNSSGLFHSRYRFQKERFQKQFNHKVIHILVLLISLGLSEFSAAQETFDAEMTQLAQATDSVEPPPVIIVQPRMEETPQHVLAGHRFLPSIYFPNPFAVPTFEFDLGFGSATFTRDFPGGPRELKIGALGPKLEAQIKIIKNLVLIAAMSGNVGFGLNGESVAFYGASARIRPRLGLLWQFIEQEKMAMSVGFEWEKPDTIQASPVEALARSIETEVTGADQPLTDEIEINRWRPTLRTAYAFNSTVGLTGFLGFNVDSQSLNDVGSDSSEYLVGLNLDTDFRPLWRVPIGLALAYRYSDIVSGEGEARQVMSVGLFETFSDRFNAGVEIGQLDSGDDEATIGAIVTRYYY